MHALPLLLSLAAAALPSSFAASHPAAHHAVPNAASHGIFAASSRQGSSLLERSAAVSEEQAMEDALCPPGEQSTANLTDEAWADEAWEDDTVVEAVLQKRDINITIPILNPKWPKNPKWAGRSSTTAASSTAGSSKSSSKAPGASPVVSLSAGIIVLGSGDSTPTSSGSPSSSRSTTSSPTKTSFQSASPSTFNSITTSMPASTSTSATKTTATSTTVLTLPSPPSTSCATAYTNTAGGAVYGPGLGNFSFSPRPSTFVKRSGTGLTVDGEEFRIVGPNIYWLGLDENVNPSPSYPTKGRIREAMAATVALGGNTASPEWHPFFASPRELTPVTSVSTGNKYSVWPNAYETNEEAFDTIDYSIWAARNYGLRLIIPLTDHGGKYDFIGWAGLDTSDASQFYYSSDVVQIFKDYIAVLLNHTNVYTAWETGNELGGYMLGGGAPPASWTKDIASYIKSLAPNHLVVDGSDGLVDTTGALASTGLSVSPVDLVTDHFYPALQWLLTKDEGYLSSYSKVFFIGELDWTGQNGGTGLSSFYSSIENLSGSGSMMWSLFTHDGQCCNFVEHNDGYSLMYPNGNTNALQKQALLLMQHWYRMRGLTPPSALPAVACPQPALEA
ncbi:SPOSA6832_03175 [Sporobolomyces salmonicolor]|uniref:mannan endo-1,4-beta-mannosidase n=1 Tax=Sporidiobolus salmonicolor TaxID=5005 RepID=A0A0D6EN31_SPOSA|nr:SPOSA6832_03175 [Sporobolomyces salmonicolor]